MITAGALVVVHCTQPSEKLWGRLSELSALGVCLRGISLASFDDWVRELATEEAPSLGPATVFVPMARVEKLYLDEPVGAVESYRQRLERRIGRGVDEVLPRPSSAA